mgnify:CR=1 FL=1
MNKQLSSLTLIFCLLLTACSGTTTAPETTDGTPQTGTTTPESTALSDDLGEYDFNKRNFNIVYSAEQLGERWPYTSDEQTGDILNDAVYKRETNVEERFNVDITWSSTGGVNSEVAKALNASVMAGDQSYQLAVNHMYGGFNALIADGLLYDFNKLDAINPDKPWWNKSARENLEIDGVLLTMSGDLIYSYYDAIYFNKRIMDERKIPYPYEKVLDGSWTWDYLAEITKGVSADLDGDGKWTDADQYGFVLDKNASTMTRLIHSNGMVMASTDENGRPSLTGMMSDKLQTVVGRYYDFVWGDDRCYYAGTTGETSCDGMFAKGNSMMMHTQTGKLPALRDVTFEFGIVPLPKYDEAQDGYHTLASTQMLLVPADIDDPEFVGVVLEALNAESYRQVVPVLYEVVYQNKYLRDSESEEMFDLIRGSIVYDLNWNYGSGNKISYLIANTVGNRNTDVASFLASNLDAAQAVLDNVYDSIEEIYAGK